MPFENLLSRKVAATQSKYQIVKKEVTQQNSYNLSIEVKDRLLACGAIAEQKNNGQDIYYTISELYTLELGEGIIRLIGETYRNKNNNIVFIYTGSNNKFQIKRTDNKDGNYEWFLKLYDLNYEGSSFEILVNIEDHVLKMDVIPPATLGQKEYELVDQKEELSFETLSDILSEYHKKYHPTPSGIYLFVMDYYNQIKDLNVSYRKEMLCKANIVESELAEWNKALGLAKNVIERNETLNKQKLQKGKKNYFSNDTKTGKNIIVYGTPGCGKSYYVENTLLKEYTEDEKEECVIRTTFYPDYSNSEFVGQLLPHAEDGKAYYEFIPGPFTLAVKKAIEYSESDKEVTLVIEEINRGNAASIFGDIFQLLDRTEGTSRYSIVNVNILDYLNKEFKGRYYFTELRIPSNLNIYATMNTDDQNVFTLDNAFKRRWTMKKLANKFTDSHEYKGYYIPEPVPGTTTWQKFVTGVNEFILKTDQSFNSEDKQIGIYFVAKEDLVDPKKPEELCEEKIENFAYKVLEFLWDDVAKLNRDAWFGDISSLDELIEKYSKDGLKVFSHGIIE